MNDNRKYLIKNRELCEHEVSYFNKRSFFLKNMMISFIIFLEKQQFRFSKRINLSLKIPKTTAAPSMIDKVN